MEQNLGPSLVGVQTSGWLYNMTLNLASKGVHLTYSGDSPFLMKLFLGKSVESSNEFPTNIPVHVCDPTFLPTLCDVSTGLRTDVSVPFRSEVPTTALVYCEDIRCICPDATHMITRCVENDLRRVALRVIRIKSPHESGPLRAFEDNLTARDAKSPTFRFLHSKKNQLKEISLSGTKALAVIADKEELADAYEGTIGNLFDGVWTGDEVLMGSDEGSNEAPAKVLKMFFPDLFNKRHPSGDDGFISIKDACELLRKSLNQCAKLLRSKNFDLATYKRWSETYYQTNLLIFGASGLTPYKLKLLIVPPLVKSGFVIRPFDHMTEAQEKSNHHANKDFQTKTMRGGGRIWQKDPLYLESSTSFCRFLKMYIESTPNVDVATALTELATIMEATVPGPEYLDICGKEIFPPQIPIGTSKTPETLLQGLRFCVVGKFSIPIQGNIQGPKTPITPKTPKTQNPKPKTPKHPGPPTINQPEMKQIISELGGTVLDSEQAKTLISSHSSLPNCFVVLKDNEDLLLSTGNDEDVAFLRQKGRRLSKARLSKVPFVESETSGSESQSKTRYSLPQCAPILKSLAAAGLKFLKFTYIFDVKQAGQILDPNPYLLIPGQNIPDRRKNRVHDIRPLLLDQCLGEKLDNFSYQCNQTS